MGYCLHIIPMPEMKVVSIRQTVAKAAENHGDDEAGCDIYRKGFKRYPHMELFSNDPSQLAQE